MGGFIVIGDAARVDSFALGGATPIAAETPDAVRRAWATLSDDVAVVVLTPEAAGALGDEVEGGRVLTVVMPA